MNRCPHCQRSIPDDAAFCIHCAAQLRPAPQTKLQEPVTGATIRLDPLEIDAPVQPAQPQTVRRRHKQHAHTKHKRHNHPRQRHHGGLGLIFVLGILFLLLTNTFFPGILVLLALMALFRATSHGRPHQGLQHLVFLGGMALVIWSGRYFPGIFLLMLASHLFSGSRYGWRP